MVLTIRASQYRADDHQILWTIYYMRLSETFRGHQRYKPWVWRETM